MAKGTAIITNETGIHARPASQLVGFLTKFTKAEINFSKDDKSVNAKSILNILALGLKKDSEITVTVTGEKEEETLAAILDYIKGLNG